MSTDSFDEAEFAALENQGFFMETTQMFGLPYRYGLPRLELDPEGLLDAVMLRAPLVAQLRTLVPWLLVHQIDGDLEQAASLGAGETPEPAIVAPYAADRLERWDRSRTTVVARPPVRYKRELSIGETIAITIGIVTLVLVAGAAIALIFFVWALL